MTEETKTLVELNISRPDGTAKKRAEKALENAEAFEIKTADDYELAAAELSAIKSKWNEIEADRKALKEPINIAARNVQAFFKPPLEFLSRAEAIVKKKMVAWKNEQDRIAREAQRKAEEKARKEQERLDRQADKAEAAGRSERAETLRERAASTVPVMPQSEAPKVSGISDRKVWQFEITDPAKVPDKYKVIDEKKIRGVVRAMKGDTEIPGVRVFEESTIAARSA